MYPQQLLNYTTAFKNAPWEVYDSPHYRFHYFKHSLAEQDIVHIVQTQEDAYAKITAFLALPSYPEKNIAYYLYPDASTKEKLMGSPWFAQSVYDDFAVHALYAEDHKVIGPHEDTHLLSLPLGLSVGFVQEGLAEYMVERDWFGNSFESVVQEALQDPQFTVAESLPTMHQAWLDTADTYARQYYSLAALFAAYIIEKYGKEKYLELYKSLKRDAQPKDNKAQYVRVLGDSLQHIFGACLANIA